MNLLLLRPEQLKDEQGAVIRGRQLRHVIDVHRAERGDSLRVGLVNGAIGEGILTGIGDTEAQLEIQWQEQPPPPLPVTLVLALPRPKMLRRIIQGSVAMGVKQLVLINSYRVDKSYWQSPWLKESQLSEQITLGLEQARDTAWVAIHQRRLFRPFVEDELATMAGDSRRLVMHPGGNQPCPAGLTQPVTLCVGPEGGFIPYEVDLIRGQGFEAVHYGPRILRTETAIPAILGRIYDTIGLN